MIYCFGLNFLGTGRLIMWNIFDKCENIMSQCDCGSLIAHDKVPRKKQPPRLPKCIERYLAALQLLLPHLLQRWATVAEPQNPWCQPDPLEWYARARAFKKPLSLHVFIYINIYIYIYKPIFKEFWGYIYIYVCIYINMYVCIYIYISIINQINIYI